MTIHDLPNNPTLAGQVRLIEDVVYAAVDGRPLKMDILTSWAQRYPDQYHPTPQPLIVFVQGSSWRTPRMGEEIPQLVRFAQNGYTVATVQHRSAIDGYPFPAFLEDVKTAIRYLRKNAKKYAIDPERVAVWGTSSGANAAMLVGLTGDDPRYETSAYSQESDRVNAVVSCFAPMDVADTFKNSSKVPGSDLLQMCLFGTKTDDWPRKKAAMSPLKQVKTGQDYPSFLLFHGDADQVVPYQEMVDMYDKLQKNGYEVDAYRVKGANHERDFWSQQIYQTVEKYLDQKLK
jgi:acetyl esterase/lipase